MFLLNSAELPQVAILGAEWVMLAMCSVSYCLSAMFTLLDQFQLQPNLPWHLPHKSHDQPTLEISND